MEAFNTLSEKRVFTDNGPQSIQVSEILAYAQLLEIDDPDERRDLLLHISALDRIYLEDAAKKRKSQQEKMKREADTRRRRRR